MYSQTGQFGKVSVIRWVKGCTGDNHAIAFYRSEEHTSELQSHHDLVCRLLLEKKKNREYENTSEQKHISKTTY